MSQEQVIPTNRMIRLFGQTITELPQDLFIPPDALEVVLHSFEGPLDLLLYLIRKQNINVLDIPMVQITEQYLAYIQHIQNQNLDLTAEYLLMAAVLIEIKSRLLLPQPEKLAEDDEVDPRIELVQRLLVYEQIKLAATQLDTLPRAGRDFSWAWLPVEIQAAKILPQISITQLTHAWLAILERNQNHQAHHITKETLSVRQQMDNILQKLAQTTSCYFSDLFYPNDTLPLIITNFLAILELAKEGQVNLYQSSHDSPIEICTLQNSNHIQVAQMV